jgi:hypothetical protein
MNFDLHRSVWRRRLALSTVLWLAGCGARVDGPSEPSASVSKSGGAPNPTVSPSPSPEPTRAAQSTNHPPTVTVTGGGSCYPGRCQIEFEAEAQDADGDALEYAWSGCASGRKRTAVCQIDDLKEFTANVRVTDGRGGETTGVGKARGVNDPPRLFIGFPTPLQPNALNFGGGYLTDEDQCGPGDIQTEISGACNKAETLCSLGGLDIELHTTGGPGECHVKVTVRDRWGAVGVASGTYPVAR